MRKHVPFARNFARPLSFFMLTVVLFAAGFTAPKSVAAQESAAAPTAGQTDTGLSGAQDRAVNEEKAEADHYRLTPLMQKIGDKLGMSPETTAKTFELVNFLIIFFAIVIPVVRIVPKMLRKRSETLNQDILTARAATADANARLSVVEQKLAGLDAEIQRFRTQIEQESVEDEKRIKASIEEEKARIVAAAEQEITQAAAQARRGLKHFAADLAITQAEKQLVLTPEVDRAVIDEFLAGASKGGSN